MVFLFFTLCVSYFRQCDEPQGSSCHKRIPHPLYFEFAGLPDSAISLAIYNPKNGDPSSSFKYLHIGVLEYWSVGGMAEGLMFTFYTPVLQHSNTPTSKLFNNFMQS